MTDHELLLAMSDLMDKKMAEQLEPLKRDIQDMKGDIGDMKRDILDMKGDIRDINLDIENNLSPKINLILENYVPASRRYEDASDKIEAMQADIDLLKLVVTEHSRKLQAILE